jgi:hypothetical protein
MPPNAYKTEVSMIDGSSSEKHNLARTMTCPKYNKIKGTTEVVLFLKPYASQSVAPEAMLWGFFLPRSRQMNSAHRRIKRLR